MAKTKSIVPDGCIDLIWSSHDGGIHVAGPDTGPYTAVLRPDEQFAGVRFRPGAAAAVLGLPAHAIRDARVPLVDIWGRDADRMAELVEAAADRPRALETLVARRVREAGPLDREAAGVLRNTGSPVAAVADELGYSERHLRRLCQETFGYGPKTLHRILRFQRAVQLIDAGRSLAEVSAACGYADQAHLTREVRALSGRPPTLLAA
jgi:AraC-like DNA-binding protein